MDLPVIILGSGGHAKVLIDVLHLRSIHIVGFTDPKEPEGMRSVHGIRYLGGDDQILHYQPDQVRLVNGLGSVGKTDQRKQIFEKFHKLGYSYATLIHPSAIIASDVNLAEGVQIMAGAVIQPGSDVGSNTLINTRVSVDHDCMIGDHVHLAPGVTLCGNIKVDDGVHIGAGATVIQGIRIEKNSIIGAGALVINPIPVGVKAMGIPAKYVDNKR